MLCSFPEHFAGKWNRLSPHKCGKNGQTERAREPMRAHPALVPPQIILLRPDMSDRKGASHEGHRLIVIEMQATLRPERDERCRH